MAKDAAKTTDGSTHRIKVTLAHIEPAIWRRLRVPSEITLSALHSVIQIAFGWSGAHLHAFRIGRDEIEDEDVSLGTIAPLKKKLVYDYDFGDDWRHDVLVERIELATPTTTAIECLDGRRAGPPEDCGGPWGYADLLATLADPTDPEHEERREWLGDDFDAEKVDVAAINEQLRALSVPRRRRAAGRRAAKADTGHAEGPAGFEAERDRIAERVNALLGAVGRPRKGSRR